MVKPDSRIDEKPPNANGNEMPQVEVRAEKIIRELKKEGVLWQAQGERRWLADLLGNEKAIAPLLRFLKTTEVGRREGARERRVEGERRNDQAGEELLD